MIERRVLRDDWWKVLAYSLVLLLNVVATLLAYPTFEANYSVILNLVPEFLSFLKDSIAGAGAFGLPVFVAINHLFKGANVVGAAAAIVLALGTIAREVEVGTIGLLLSRPISRRRILLSFAWVHLLELTIPLLLVSLVTPWLATTLIDRELPLAPLMLASVHACLFVSVIYGLALLAAVVFTEQVKVAAAAGGLCVISFILYFIDATRPFTLYRLSSLDLYTELARGEGGALPEAVVCGGILAVSVALAIYVFRRRDY